MNYRRPKSFLPLSAAVRLVVLLSAATIRADVAGDEPVLPDRNNPDYVYVEDFENGREQNEQLPVFSIAGRHGVREGAGWKSRYGYSNVLVENDGFPPYPEVKFPMQSGVVFVQWMVKVPSNFFLGRSDHGYYLYDGTKNRTGNMVVIDSSVDHPIWLDPDWDPYTIPVLRGSGYHRMTRSFEGFEPLRRGEWHSYQMMIVMSEKDPAIGRMKVWIDGTLANFCKHDTIPRMDTFWISNYWHSWEYVPKDKYSNLFEAHTAPLHPAFEILLDNLIVSKSFIEFGPNQAQVERLRLTNISTDGFDFRFDSTTKAAKISVLAGEAGDDWLAHATTIDGEIEAPGYFHAIPIRNLEAGRRYNLLAVVEDVKGRRLESQPLALEISADKTPTLLHKAAAAPETRSAAGAWRGEVFAGHDLSVTPSMLRYFDSLSFVSWPGVDGELDFDTTQSMAVRYSKKALFEAGTHVFRFGVSDGLRVTLNGEVLHESIRRTQGHKHYKVLKREISAGEHELVVEHFLWRTGDWEQNVSKYLAFRITREPGTAPPVCLSQAIYSTRFHKPEEPLYSARWSSDDLEFNLEFGETPDYGQSVKGSGRLPRINLGTLEVGKKYHWRITATDSLGNRTVTPDATFVCGDTIPPRKILCRLKRVSPTTLELSFTAPGEDSKHGQAVSYDIRWSDKPITIYNWEQATRMTDPPAPQVARSQEEILLEGLPAGTTWHVAVRAIDLAGLASLLSNSVSDPPGPEVMDCDGDGYGVGSLLGPDPDDYDANVPGPAGAATAPVTWNKPLVE